MDTRLMQQVEAAMAKFDAHRDGIEDARRRVESVERFERACMFNRAVTKDDRENRLVRGARQRGYTAFG